MTYNEAEPSSPERRRLALIGGGIAIFLAAAGATLLIINRPEEETTLIAAGTPVGEVAVSVSPTSSLTPAGPVGTPTPIPTATPLPPFEHLVLPGEGLIDIVQLYGYRTIDIFDAIIALNGLASPDDVQVGQVLLIPRQTATPGPTPDPDDTQAPAGAVAPVGATSPSIQGGDPENRVTSEDGQFWVHTVRPGDSIAQIAFIYDSHVPCILRNNNMLYNAEGEPIIAEGQQINVCIVSTLTPTPSPTGDPSNSTGTPVPTQDSPLLVAPANGAVFGRAEDVTLQWAVIFPLAEGQYYQVIALDLTGNREFRATTTANAFTLPNELRPPIGQSAQLQWRVVIVEGTAVDAPVVSSLGEVWEFIWGG